MSPIDRSETHQEKSADSSKPIRGQKHPIGDSSSGNTKKMYTQSSPQRHGSPSHGPHGSDRNVFEKCMEMITKHTLDPTRTTKKLYTFPDWDFYKELRQCPDIARMTNIKGQNLLVIIVLEGRTDLLEPLFYCGILQELYKMKISQPGSPYMNHSAKDLIEKFNKRELANKLSNFFNKENSMSELQKVIRRGTPDYVLQELEKTQVKGMSPSEANDCLIWAVTSGNLEIVKIIGSSLEIQPNFPSQETPLGRATYYSFTEIVRYLIQNLSFSPDEKCKNDSTPLCIAIEHTDLDLMRVLFECRASITSRILLDIARNGSLDIWKYVLDNVRSLDINVKDADGKTPLYIALENNHIGIVKCIIEENARDKTKCLTQTNRIERSILFAAIDNGHFEMFQYILDKLKYYNCLKQIIDKQDRYWGKERQHSVIARDGGWLGFHFVEVNRLCLDIYSKKVHAGGQMDVLHYGTIIKSGLNKPSTQEVQEFNERYNTATIDVTKRLPDMAPLHYAILNKQTKMALTLIENGADRDKKDSFGNQPIHLATMRGDREIIDALFAKGIYLEAVQSEASHMDHFSLPGIASFNWHYDIDNYFEEMDIPDESDVERKWYRFP